MVGGQISKAQMKDFKDKILFVTGGASGAGLGQAKVFSEAGCQAVIADVRQDHLEEAAAYSREKNASVHTINLDITDRAAKAAVINLMESYRLSLGKYGIGVSMLCPASINSNIHNATDRRPAHLAGTGYLGDDLAVKSLQTIYESGMDPIDLAKCLKKGIETKQLYVIPYPEEKEALERHFKEMAGEVAKNNPDAPLQPGFDRARPEIDWVKPMEIPSTFLNDE